MQKKKPAHQELVPVEIIERRILLVRGHKVMLDLADLYEVTTGNLNKAVKRNLKRFPEDFMFQLTKEEADDLRFQIGISKAAGGRVKVSSHVNHGPAQSSRLARFAGRRRRSRNEPRNRLVILGDDDLVARRKMMNQ